MVLKNYASDPLVSRGRLHIEPGTTNRNAFQRDRDRIIHSSAFRRLEYKTQVFVNHEGDMFRTRLTHSIEVSQIARSIARALECHEDLAETIALAHDLGHTPFGHAGQDALNQCMRDFGGFEHNLQSLRIVDSLEKRYAHCDGLNLMFESREGILKHCSITNAKTLGAIGERFIHKTQPSLEAQIVNIADEIAYINHDIDDGFRSGLLTIDALSSNTLFATCAEEVKGFCSESNGEVFINEVVRRMIHWMVSDLIINSQEHIQNHHPQSTDDVRRMPPLINYTDSMLTQKQQMKTFLRHGMYEHERVAAMTDSAKSTVHQLFQYFMQDESHIPEAFKNQSKDTYPRIVSDYIAGMTDRFAIQLAATIV